MGNFLRRASFFLMAGVVTVGALGISDDLCLVFFSLGFGELSERGAEKLGSGRLGNLIKRIANSSFGVSAETILMVVEAVDFRIGNKEEAWGTILLNAT